MNEKILEDIKKRLECMILLFCKNNVSENEKLKMKNQTKIGSENESFLEEPFYDF